MMWPVISIGNKIGFILSYPTQHPAGQKYGLRRNEKESSCPAKIFHSWSAWSKYSQRRRRRGFNTMLTAYFTVNHNKRLHAGY